jgi:hypothetical protein
LSRIPAVGDALVQSVSGLCVVHLSSDSDSCINPGDSGLLLVSKLREAALCSTCYEASPRFNAKCPVGVVRSDLLAGEEVRPTARRIGFLNE